MPFLLAMHWDKFIVISHSRMHTGKLCARRERRAAMAKNHYHHLDFDVQHEL